MKSDIYLIDRGDVKIERIESLLCEECENVATRQVVLDLRNAGSGVIIGKFCVQHAKRMAKRVKQGLPIEE